MQLYHITVLKCIDGRLALYSTAVVVLSVWVTVVITAVVKVSHRLLIVCHALMIMRPTPLLYGRHIAKQVPYRNHLRSHKPLKY